MKSIMRNVPIRETITERDIEGVKQAERKRQLELALAMEQVQAEKDAKKKMILAVATVKYKEIIESVDPADLQGVINRLVMEKVADSVDSDVVKVNEIVIDQLQRDITMQHSECQLGATIYERPIQRIR